MRHLLILSLLGLLVSSFAQADDYRTCRDNGDIAFQHLQRMIPLAERGNASAQERVAELDAQLHDICLCKQAEWDELNDEYATALIEASDGHRRVRLARPFVLSLQRPECTAPTARVWYVPEPDQSSETEG